MENEEESTRCEYRIRRGGGNRVAINDAIERLRVWGWLVCVCGKAALAFSLSLSLQQCTRGIDKPLPLVSIGYPLDPLGAESITANDNAKLEETSDRGKRGPILRFRVNAD